MRTGLLFIMGIAAFLLLVRCTFEESPTAPGPAPAVAQPDTTFLWTGSGKWVRIEESWTRESDGTWECYRTEVWQYGFTRGGTFGLHYWIDGQEVASSRVTGLYCVTEEGAGRERKIRIWFKHAGVPEIGMQPNAYSIVFTVSGDRTVMRTEEGGFYFFKVAE